MNKTENNNLSFIQHGHEIVQCDGSDINVLDFMLEILNADMWDNGETAYMDLTLNGKIIRYPLLYTEEDARWFGIPDQPNFTLPKGDGAGREFYVPITVEMWAEYCLELDAQPDHPLNAEFASLNK